MSIGDLIGKRILISSVTSYPIHQRIQEVKVLEASPTGNWTRLMNTNGLKYWTATKDIALVEVLADIEPCPGPPEHEAAS